MYDSIDTGAMERVWERVATTPESDYLPPTEPDILMDLRAFMDSAVYAGRMYELLASKNRGGRLQRELAELAGEERATEKRLQTEYFLLTGDTWAPTPAQPSAPYLIRALRDAYAGETENAGKYAAAARRLPGCQLRKTLEQLSQKEQRHAGALRRMVERIIG